VGRRPLNNAGAARARSSGPRLTIHFAVLLAVVALAAAAGTVYVFVQTDRDSRSTAEKDTRFAAHTAARDLGGGIAAIRSTVAGLAATPNIDQAARQPS